MAGKRTTFRAEFKKQLVELYLQEQHEKTLAQVARENLSACDSSGRPRHDLGVGAAGEGAHGVPVKVTGLTAGLP